MNIFKRLYRFLLKPIYTRLDEQNKKAEKMAAEMSALESLVADIRNTISSYDDTVRCVNRNTAGIEDLVKALQGVRNSISDNALGISRNAAVIESLKAELGLHGKDIGDLLERVSGVEGSVSDNALEISRNAAAIESLKSELGLHGKDIGDLLERVSGVEGSVSDNALEITRSTDAIEEKMKGYAAFEPRLTQNEKDIVRVINTINRYHDNAYLDTMDYLQFENRFRGRREQIMGSQKQYIRYFSGKGNVVDLGCGRGEFLELLSAEGIPAVGVDLNETFVGLCKGKGLNAVCGDAIQYLRKMTKKVDGIFCSQMAEHMSKAKLLELCRVCYSHMEDGAYIVFETPNASSLFTMTHGFYVDPTHDRPVHYLLFQYFLEISGFKDVEVIFTEESREGIPRIPHIEGGDGCCNAREMNRAIDEMNRMLFGSQDYAIIARR